MGFRFQKRQSLLGGLMRLNFSKGGISVSTGVPGVHVNYDLSGRRKPMATFSLPGTGLSYRQTLGNPRPVPSQSADPEMQMMCDELDRERYGSWRKTKLVLWGIFWAIAIIGFLIWILN
jgi:hypothetical protein